MLPSSYFKVFAEETPIVVFNGRVFQVDNATEGGDNYLDLGGARYSLNELETIAKFEALYMENHEDQIEKFKKKIIKQEVEKARVSKKEVYEMSKENKVLSFIINDVFPLVLEQDHEYEGLVDGKVKEKKTGEDYLHKLLKDMGVEEEKSAKAPGRSKRKRKAAQAPDLEEKVLFRKPSRGSSSSQRSDPLPTLLEDRDIETLISVTRDSSDDLEYDDLEDDDFEDDDLEDDDFEDDDEDFPADMDGEIESLIKNYARQKRENIPSILTSQVLSGKNIFCIKGFAYELGRGRGDESMQLVFNGSVFIPVPLAPLSAIEENYIQFLEEKIKYDCLDENEKLQDELEKVEKEKKTMKTFLQQNEFCKDNLGFIKKNGNYYVYIKTPEFVLKNPSGGGLYHFKSCRVGVNVYHKNGQVGYESSPLVIDSYSHPFLRGGGSFQSICMGGYQYDKLKKYDTAEGLVKLLSDARQVIVSGYMTGSGPHHKLGEFSSRRISEENVKKKGLQITNLVASRRRS